MPRAAKVPKVHARYSCTAIRDVVRRDGFFKMCEAMSTRSGCRIARALNLLEAVERDEVKVEEVKP